MRAQWEERLAAYVRTSFAAAMLGAGGQIAIQYISKLTTAVLLLFGAKAVIDGELTVGALVAFNMIAAQAVAADPAAVAALAGFPAGADLGRPPRRHPQCAARTLAAARLLPPAPRGAIEFRRVTFRYRPGAPDVLKDVSLSIRPGEVIGIVGPSGSGKSTLTKLVQRLYLPNEGQVLLDGADLSQVDPAWLRSHIGVVLQENLLFNRTIHDNIAFANPAMPRARVIEIARLAGADEFIAKLAEGYDTMIEERGANLSGGQRQRIAIARALATNPPILIFDEATSALDYESERIIQRNMRHIVKDRTVIIIAHRLAAVRRCDRIVGMVDGRIVEIGTHDELLRRPGGLYAISGPAEAAGGDRRMTVIRRGPCREESASRRRSCWPRARSRGFGRRRRDDAATRNSSRPRSKFWRRRRLRSMSLSYGSLRLRRRGAGLGLFRPRRHHRRRAGQVSADRAGQGRRAAGDRQGEAIRRQQRPIVKAGDVLVELDRRRPWPTGRRPRGARVCAGGNPAPQDRVRKRAVASLRARAADRLAGGRRAGLARARQPVLAADLAQLARQSLTRRRAARRSRPSATNCGKTIATQKRLVATLQERVDMRTTLVDIKAGAKAAVIDATETLQYQLTQEAKQEQARLPTAGLGVIAASPQGVQDFIAENAQKLAEAERQADDSRSASPRPRPNSIA